MAALRELRALWHVLPRGETGAFAAYVLLSVGAALAGSLSAVLLVPLVHPGGAVSPVEGVQANALWFAVSGIVFALMRWQSSRIGARQVGRLIHHLRTGVHARLLDAPLPELAHLRSAEIANVLTHNGESLAQAFRAMQQIAVTAITSLASFGFAIWISPVLMLMVPLVLVLVLATSRLAVRELSAVGKRYVADYTSLFWHSEDFPRRLRHIRSFGREAAERDSYGEVSASLADGYRRQLELVASSRAVIEVAAAVGIPAMFLLAQRWHGVSSESLIAVGLLLGRLLPYLMSTREAFQQWRAAMPALALWQRYMGLHAGAENGAAAFASPGELLIRRLRIRPPGDGLRVEGMRLAAGELTLVSGDSGIGKSSLVDVLSGMVPAECFDAEHDGVPIDAAAYRALIARGAYVCQNVRPWQRTVRECLAWAAPEASEAQMREALADVGLARRLDAGGMDLETTVNDADGRLSGGELQRLLVAQVILRRPALAILDEATSALDAASELAVLGALRRRLPRGILLVVSHRPAVAALADQVVRIDADGVAVTGPVTA